MDKYIPVYQKFIISCVLSTVWTVFSIIVAKIWITNLSKETNIFIADFIIYGIAIIPGFINSFMFFSLILDKRPLRKKFLNSEYPPITILIAAYNEEKNIVSTIKSIEHQKYPGKMIVYVINDGSTDDTANIVRKLETTYSFVNLIDLKKNQGKSAALNHALKLTETDLTVTIDGDSYLHENALKNIVERYKSDPKNTVAVAGAIFVRNAKVNFLTKIQQWDYFHGIASVKRLQSLYHGTLVAQGAFSLYETKVLKEVGGWGKHVGEDIVLTWAILKKGHRVGFAEDAILFTNVPEQWRQFIKQRQRWSRGLIEAFREHWQLLFKSRYTTLFIWWNLLFPYLDLSYTFGFVPGLILCIFGIFWIVGPMTLLLLPFTFLMNYIMYHNSNSVFKGQGVEHIKIKDNLFHFIMYTLFYSMILQPACVFGYIKEFFWGRVKNWGTK